MAIHGISLAETEPFILPMDPGHPDKVALLPESDVPETPTVFTIGILTVNDRTELGDMGATPTMRDAGISMQPRNVQKAYEVVRRGLKGWENFIVGDAPTAFDTKTDNVAGAFRSVVSDACMLVLPKEIIIELSAAILERNGMRTDMEKKLEGASLLSDVVGSTVGDAIPAPTKTKPVAAAPKKPKGA